MSAAVRDSLARLRPMTAHDLDEVVVLEQDSYEFPWTRGIFSDCLRMGYRCLVAEDREGVQGYYVLTLGVHEAHLLNICVGADWRGRGLGRMLLHHALEEARAEAAETMFLEVRPSNRHALALYESEGFAEIGRRKNYYRSATGREDALILARNCG